MVLEFPRKKSKFKMDWKAVARSDRTTTTRVADPAPGRNMGAAPRKDLAADRGHQALTQLHTSLRLLDAQWTIFEEAVSALADMRWVLETSLLKDELVRVTTAFNQLMDVQFVSRGELAAIASCLDQLCPDPQRTREKMDTESAKPVSESYRLRPHLLDEALKITKIKLQVDAFSVGSTRQCTRWWGPDSPEATDAFRQPWNQDIMWMNPPYSVWDRVVAKIREDQAHALFCVPEWNTRLWWRNLQSMVAWRWRIAPGEKVFELYNRPCSPTHWAVHIVAVCGAEPRCYLAELRAGRVHGRPDPAAASHHPDFAEADQVLQETGAAEASQAEVAEDLGGDAVSAGSWQAVGLAALVLMQDPSLYPDLTSRSPRRKKRRWQSSKEGHVAGPGVSKRRWQRPRCERVILPDVLLSTGTAAT